MHSYKVALQCCRASTAIFKSHLYVGLHCVSKKQHHIFRCNLTNDFDKLQKQGLGCVLGLMRERSLTPAVGQVGIKPDNFPPMVCSLFRDARMNLKLGGGRICAFTQCKKCQNFVLLLIPKQYHLKCKNNINIVLYLGCADIILGAFNKIEIFIQDTGLVEYRL